MNTIHKALSSLQRRSRKLLAQRRGVSEDQIDWRLGSPHDFRDTYILTLVNGGVPVHVVQRLAGHATPTVTLRYYTQATKADAARVLGALQGTSKVLAAAEVA